MLSGTATPIATNAATIESLFMCPPFGTSMASDGRGLPAPPSSASPLRMCDRITSPDRAVNVPAVTLIRAPDRRSEERRSVPTRTNVDVEDLQRLADEDLMPLVERKDPARSRSSTTATAARPTRSPTGSSATGAWRRTSPRRPSCRSGAAAPASTARAAACGPGCWASSATARSTCCAARPAARRRSASSWSACPSRSRGSSHRRGGAAPRGRARGARGAQRAARGPGQGRAARLFRGLTHAEIAEVLGMPLGTVKGRMRLAMEKMRAKLAEGV